MLNRRFLHLDSSSIDISKFRFIVGLIIGLLYAFSFYSFFYISRETLRIMSVSPDYSLWVLTDDEVNFYNFFFASISIIMGHSKAISFWIDRPKKFLSASYFRKSSILNDQRFLKWYFLSAFSKMAIVFAVFFGLAYHFGYMEFSLYPKYNYVFILIIIVLYFQIWVTIRRTFLKKSLRWLMLSAVATIIFSFGLSRINLIDYKSINKTILKNNISHNYKYKLPESSAFERYYRLSLLEDLYIVEEKNGDKEPIVLYNNVKIEFNQLAELITFWKSERDEWDMPHFKVILRIHSGVSMEFVNSIRKILIENNIYNIGYAIKPTSERDRAHTNHFHLPLNLANNIFNGVDYNNTQNKINQFSNLIRIYQDSTNTIYFNNRVINTNNLKSIIKSRILRNTEYAILLEIDNKIDFETYLKYISISFEVIHEIREDYSERVFSQKLNRLNRFERTKVKEKFRLNLYEIIE